MIQDFINTQLLSDQDWETYLKTGSFSFQEDDKTPATRLKVLLYEGMQEEKLDIEQIVTQAALPDFENTIIALAESGQKLSRATTILYNLLSAETSDELDELASEMASVLSEHENDITLNPDLFARVKAVYEHPSQQLTAEDRMLLDKTYQAFERSGATLGTEEQQIFRRITSELAQETIRFSQNLLKSTNSYVLHLTQEDDLAGIPEIHRDAAAQEARDRNENGWIFTLQAPSFIPFMMYADRREYREHMYRAYHSRCTHDDKYNNFEVVRHIVNLRRELSVLLGYDNYAEYALKRRMASTPAKVFQLLEELINHYHTQAQQEVAQVVEKAKSLEGDDFVFQAWDFAYYSQKLKTELFNYDPDKLRPYFQLSNVVNGVFSLATRLYGITFEVDSQMPVYHEDVQCYKVYDNDHTYLAHLLLDFFPRKGKQSGAWMTSYRDEHSQGISSSQQVTTLNSCRPVVSITTNFTKPTEDKPSLLTLGEVETLLHEFGHALHGMFAMTHHASLSGTSVYWDFVELPSQFMENFAVQPEFLKTFAFHYQTGELLPEEFLSQIRLSRNFQVAYACMRQVSFGLLDMAYYTQKTVFTDDVRTFEHRIWEPLQLLPLVSESCMSVQFGHIMSGGYAAGYYSYKWSEVLDADAFAAFKQDGIFSSVLANRFRKYILSQGGTSAPMELYKAFRGKEPSIEALLQRDGIQAVSE